MTTVSSYNCASSALLGSLRELKSYGSDVTVRGMHTKEILGHTFTVYNPVNRFTILPFRKCNPFAQIAETMWMIAGRDDLDWLELYIPQCKKWSDDGETWRDAYGPRLRHWGQQYEVLGSGIYPVGWAVDQFAEIVKRLSSDSYSRQAVMTIWNPAIDNITDSKAYPCNIALQFMVRNNLLHMFVTVRSNDVIYGFSHNDFYSWSILLQMMAKWVGVGVGSLHWNASSFHIYERHFQLSQNIIDSTHPRQFFYDYNVPTLLFDTEFGDIDKELSTMFHWENKARECALTESYPSELTMDDFQFSRDSFIDTCTRMLMLYVILVRVTSQHKDLIIDIVGTIPYSDFRLAAIDYICRKEWMSLFDFAHLIDSSGVYDYLDNIQNCQSQL